ncbi:MAG: NAD(P)H-dependent oxidoreductase [Elusimicrobiaceae bacterium]|nr:NAD(P)H-dependent oxidoreductase [Elusimicrobiaceae bacterium]MBQ6224641.1 NAD(P)H-dependent oxidoreductase [Campylobacter sp.]
MRKLSFLFILFCAVACGVKTQETPNIDVKTTPVIKQNAKALVAYFSHTGENYGVGYITIGNTQKVALEIATQTGAELFRIETIKDYPKTYQSCTEVSKEELKENARPELKAKPENMQDYDIIYLGYPIWWGDMPMAVYTFLESYNLEGKIIMPFATHEGSHMGRTEENLKKLLPKTTIGQGLAIYGTTAQTDSEATQKAVRNWLKK